MKRGKVIIDSAFGDCGKGLMSDYFCRQAKNPIVVRFNGGAQAGHTAVDEKYGRHVFHHFGAGTFAGADTYLSEYFLVNPVAWKQEATELFDAFDNTGVPFLYVHPDAPVTTIYDMFINQKLEESRTKRHGSCGMGVHETMLRHEHPDYNLPAYWLCNNPGMLELTMSCIRNYAISRAKLLKLDSEENMTWLKNDAILEQFIKDCNEFANHMLLVNEKILEDRDVIFEGAQGLLLDEKNTRFFPHVTHSRTGLTNVVPIAQKAGLDALDVIYVARTYLTRHGAGELPNEDPKLSYEDTTNVHNPWQQTLRFAPQNEELIMEAICTDFLDAGKPMELKANLAITHMDQKEWLPTAKYIPVAYVSSGPKHEDVQCLSR